VGTKQEWAIGNTVRMWGNAYVILDQLPPKEPGQAKRWVLQTEDKARVYEWVPFRGLTLVSGQPTTPKRVRNRKRKATIARPAPTPRAPQLVRKGTLWHRLARVLGLRKPPKTRGNPDAVKAPGRPISTPPGTHAKGVPSG
jgi:hypothetical protein